MRPICARTFYEDCHIEDPLLCIVPFVVLNSADYPAKSNSCVRGTVGINLNTYPGFHGLVGTCEQSPDNCALFRRIWIQSNSLISNLPGHTLKQCSHDTTCSCSTIFRKRLPSRSWAAEYSQQGVCRRESRTYRRQANSPDLPREEREGSCCPKRA